MRVIHRRKCHPAPLKDILTGKKKHEIRLEDRPTEPPFNDGDGLILEEWDPLSGDYTGLKVGLDITYVSREGAALQAMGLDLGKIVVLSIEWVWAVHGPMRFKSIGWAPARETDGLEAAARG